MTVGVVGLGLIGGSLAKAIKLNTPHKVLGTDIDEAVMCRALLMGAVDERFSEENAGECDIVIIALFPQHTLTALEKYAPYIKKGAVAVDTCGVKRAVCDRAWELAEENGFVFVGGHPMAGREKIGFSASKHDLFQNASMILVPQGDVELEIMSMLKQFFASLGFGKIVMSRAEYHDEMIGYTSQLAHIVSGAYIKNPLSAKAAGFSAGSFRDMTRVATLNEKMWCELFLDNSDFLSGQVEHLIQRLQEYKAALDSRDEKALTKLLLEGKEAKELSESAMNN